MKPVITACSKCSKSLALCTSQVARVKISVRGLAEMADATFLSQAFWTLFSHIHFGWIGQTCQTPSAGSTDWSASTEMVSGRMDCLSCNTDAADARKAEVSASKHSYFQGLHLRKVVMPKATGSHYCRHSYYHHRCHHHQKSHRETIKIWE